MNSVQHPSAQWMATNQAYLSTWVAYFKFRLGRAYGQSQDADSQEQENAFQVQLAELKQAFASPAPIDYLASLFRLNDFEQQLLLLCVASELDSHILKSPIDASALKLNFSLALAVLPNADWHALTAGAPLRRHRLLELDNKQSLTQTPLHLPESILHFIVGYVDEDQDLTALTQEVSNDMSVLDSRNRLLATDILRFWDSQQSAKNQQITLTGDYHEVKKELAAAVATALDCRLLILPVTAIPLDADKLKRFVADWEREVLLHNYLLFLDFELAIELESAVKSAATRFISMFRWSLFVGHQENVAQGSGKKQLQLDVHAPSSAEQIAHWQHCLQDRVPIAEINRVASHFTYSLSSIAHFADLHLSLQREKSLWNICRQFSQHKTPALVETITPSPGAEQIVLPQAQHKALRDILSHVQNKAIVYGDWGFAQQSARGQGVTALFYGASGTGKTTAAEYLALALELDLYRIELSSVVSKYIGETEKNLQQVFAAAEQSGAILLFDEADALFSKRTQISGANDKFANAQVSYLLQRFESFKGLAILTSNLKDAFDAAFIRRLRFVIQFPFPGTKERQQIWQSAIPAQAPTQDIDFQKLANLNAAGGVIRNITQHACFSAAADQEPLQMKHLLDATRTEYQKHDKTLAISEVQGWV